MLNSIDKLDCIKASLDMSSESITNKTINEVIEDIKSKNLYIEFLEKELKQSKEEYKKALCS